jgi:autophagy-related protein 17
MASSPSPSKPSSSQSDNDFSSPLPEHLHTLENHAQEMASLLESLVSHFDLCVNAIRNTEGGYAAALKAASSQPPDVDPVSVSGVMNAESESAQEEPMSEEERKEMLDVLEKDASQVDDVVMELREFLAEMEVRHEAIIEHVASLTTTYKGTMNAYNILEGIGSRLPNYIIASQDFRIRWEETKLQIQEQLSELESMRLFYENYYSSYDSMILEIHRRKQCEEKVRGIMKKAMEQIDKVYQSDMREREEFRLDVGEYLPVDLFPGVNTPAPKWDFVLAEGQDPGLASLPDVEKVVVEAANRRERERHRSDR